MRAPSGISSPLGRPGSRCRRSVRAPSARSARPGACFGAAARIARPATGAGESADAGVERAGLVRRSPPGPRPSRRRAAPPAHQHVDLLGSRPSRRPTRPRATATPRRRGGRARRGPGRARRGPGRRAGAAAALAGVHPLVGQSSASAASPASSGSDDEPNEALIVEPFAVLAQRGDGARTSGASSVRAPGSRTQNSSPPSR